MPTEAEEVWRYSRISQLDLDAYRPVDPRAGEPLATPLPEPLDRALSIAGVRSGVVVVHNGVIVHLEVDPAMASRGLAIAPASSLLPEDPGIVGAVASSTTDALTELNAAFVIDPLVIRVPAGMTVPDPIVVLHWFDRDDLAAFPHTVVVTGADSEAAIAEYHASADVSTFVDPVVELEVGDASRLRYLNVQDLGSRVWQTAYHASRVGRDATLQSAVVALGGDYARVRTDSKLVGRGGTSNLLALYFGSGSQMHDFRTMQDHEGPQTTSDLLFKGALSGVSRSVYSGLIRVRKGAAGTNAFQTNRNLVLSEGAHADSVPNLEIEENQLQCSHASAVGPIDEEQRFYLESRGIPTWIAERLIVLGFFGEVLARLPVPAYASALRERVAAELEVVAGRSAAAESDVP